VDPLLIALALLVMLVGLVGVVVPVLPGLLLVWLASAGTVLFVGTDTAGWVLAIVLTLLFAVGSGATFLAPGPAGTTRRRPAAVAASGAGRCRRRVLRDPRRGLPRRGLRRTPGR
jgi:uncharacterized protein YqgC (DUF456 family)